MGKNVINAVGVRRFSNVIVNIPNILGRLLERNQINALNLIRLSHRIVNLLLIFCVLILQVTFYVLF